MLGQEKLPARIALRSPMTENVCKKCGKPFLAERAGSVTSFFFQHNYCQCHNANNSSSNSNNSSNSSKSSKSNSNEASPSGAKQAKNEASLGYADNQICKNCGKSRPTEKRAGSFTSFLFKELRCTCAGPSSNSSAKRPGSANNSGRTTTAARTAQRKQFTQSIRNRAPSSQQSAQQPAAQAILPSDSIVGGFKIISLIGVGGMGAVYLVEHMSLHRQLALKILTPELVNEQNWQRFKAEAKILASLSHPTLVKVYDLGIHAQTIPFYSMDYLEGRSIEEILADDGPIDLETTIDIMLEVLDGLAYAHRNGIVHRDLKPGNIMYCTIDGAKAVKVLDFGISKLIDNRGTSQAMTVAGDIFGSPFYMSPEQSRGDRVDARSDIYSIGCTLFEMLTGFVPYENKSSIEIMLMHQEADIPLLTEVCDIEFPPSVDLVLAKCLAKSPDARYQSAKELALDLVRIKEGKAVHAYSKGFAQRGAIAADKEEAAQQTSNSAIVLSGLAAATLVVSCSIFYFWSNQQNHGSKSRAKAPVNANFDGDRVLPESEFTDLTTAKPIYFALVSKDGMSATFKFPSNQSLGRIGCDAPNCKMFEAQSLVHLSLKDGLKLEANNYLLEHPSLFEGFRPNEIACLSAPSGGEEVIKVSTAMPHICKLTGISRLDLQLSNLDDSDVPYFNKLTRLSSLSLSLTEVTGKGLANFQHLKNLHMLSFNYNNGIHELIEALAGSENIEDLSIDSPDKPIEAADLQRLAKLKNLNFLSVQNSGIDDKSLEILYGMPRLATLNINECTVSNAAIEKFKKSYGGKKIEVISTQTQLLKSKGGLKGDPETGL